MDPDLALLRVAIAPDVPLALEWAAPERLLIRTGPRQPGVVYHLTLGAARSQLGSPLASPLSLTFGQGGDGAPIPILMYHHVQLLEPGALATMRKLTVSPQELAAQLDYMAGLGAHVVSLGEVVDYMRDGEPLPPRPVVLTFDDGYKSAYQHVAPILQKRGATATFFIVPAYVDYRAYMDWAELQALVEAGFTIGCHSYDHVRVHELAGAQVERQFGASRRILQERLGVTVDLFAYPYGNYSRSAMHQLADYGYRGAVSVEPVVHQKPERVLALGRISVGYGDSLERLRQQLPW
jgi:peptidoglycan/xylan/chitin deacetylase (PgdA/CDA1 family)